MTTKVGQGLGLGYFSMISDTPQLETHVHLGRQCCYAIIVQSYRGGKDGQQKGDTEGWTHLDFGIRLVKIRYKFM